mgnify:CR=1 FL=1
MSETAAGAVALSPVGPFDFSLYWLIAGGMAGALVRSLWTHGQKNFGWETAQDVVVGALIGGLYTLEFDLPGLGIRWPFIPLPAQATDLQRALVIAVISMVSVAVIKRMLMTWAPTYMAKFAGPLAPANGSGMPSSPGPHHP